MNFKSKIQKFFEKQDIITFIDIASNYVSCAVLSFKEDDTFKVMGFARGKSLGIRNGAIVDIKQATQSLGKVLEDVEEQSSIRANKVVVSCLLPLSKHIVYPYGNSIGTIVNNDKLYQIFHPDLFKAKVDYSEFLLHLFAENMYFDNVKIDNPNGLFVDYITADVHMVTVPYASFLNLMELLNYFALSPKLILYSPLASGYGVMSKEELGLSVLVIEIAYDTTSYCVFKDDILVKTGFIEYGIEHIIVELAKELNITKDVAERLFFHYGEQTEKVDDSTIQIKYGEKSYNIQSSLVGYKVKEGYKNIFNKISKLAMKGNKNLLDRIILTGQGAFYEEVEDICKDVCNFINYSSFNVIKRKPIAKNQGDMSFSDNVIYGMIKYYINSRDFDFGMRYFTENIEKKLIK